MDELITWLRAQLDVDERVINAACIHIADCTGTGYADRFDDDWLLGEVEAKRRILDDYDIVVSAIRRVDDVDGNALLYARRDARMTDIRWLAQPYAGQPGWRTEWQLNTPAQEVDVD